MGVADRHLLALSSRRRALRLLALGATGLLTACQSAPPAAPTAAPAPKPTDAPKPIAPAATTAPVAPVPPANAPAQAAPAVAAPKPAAIQPLATRGKLKLTVSPSNINSLPLLVAMDKGTFASAGLDVEFIPRKSSAVGLLPQLSRGDLDISDMVAAPGLYNQASQGFDVRIVGSLSQPREGRLTDTWLVVLKDQADVIKDWKDLKGKTIEGVAEGTPGDLLTSEAIRLAGLTPGQDVTQTFRVKQTPDYLALTRAHAADVIAMNEPLATQAEQEGLVVRWKTYGFGDLAPWFRTSLLAASGQLIEKNRPVLEKFLEVFVASSREIDATNGTWTPDLIASAAKWSELPPETIKQMGGVPYFDPNGKVSLDSLDKAQDVWVARGQVKERVDSKKLLDVQAMEAAVARLGRVS